MGIDVVGNNKTNERASFDGPVIARCSATEDRELIVLSHHFQRDGFLKVGHLLTPEAKRVVRDDVIRLIDRFSERNELSLETTGGTPRRMSTVRSEYIGEHGREVPQVYRSAELVELFEKIAGEKLSPCPSKDEEYLITKQEKVGDTHGWHWGDYSYALIWIIDTPPIEFGGMLQCVPHTRWNKKDPRINFFLASNAIKTYSFVPGDVYFLRTDTTLHRTVPLSQPCVRIILNMTWANAQDLTRKIEGNDRWWAADGEVARRALQVAASGEARETAP